jgi:copper chaperone CopZ
MEKKFKTNIKCSACVEKVTPYLNEAVGADQWNVDLASPQRILTVSGAASESEVAESLRKAGYTAEKV